MRLIAAIVETPISEISVGAPVRAQFAKAANGKVPVFRLVSGGNLMTFVFSADGHITEPGDLLTEGLPASLRKHGIRMPRCATAIAICWRARR